jgi:tetratricopeptide (TPR) repeat protein
MWSKRFDREMHDVFAIQDEIAAAITHAFKGSLRGEVAASTRLRHSEDIEAYELCLRGRYFLAKRVEGLPQAHAFYERAVERDPQYALALAGLGEVCTLMGIYLFLPPMEAFSEARKAAAAALALDPRLPESHLALAGVSFHHDWDWEAAQRGFEKALELRHQDPLMRIWLAYFLAVIGDFDRALGLSEQAAREDPLSHYVQGARQIVLYVARRFEEAIEVAEKMIEIDPHNSEPYRWGGISFALLGRWEEAVEWLQRAMMLSGRHVYAIMDLASTLAMLGQEEEARELLAELEERRAREWIPSMSISMACAALGDIESALDWLELAYDERDVWIPALGTDPRFDPLRGQRRFEQMRERLGLPG